VEVINLGGKCCVCGKNVRSGVILDLGRDLGQGTSSHTREGLKGSCRLLLELFSEIIREEKVVNIALIAQGVLVMRANWGI
jgi:hypothetical protein